MSVRSVRAVATLLVLVVAFTVPGVATAQTVVELERARERAADLDERVATAEDRLERARREVADLEDELRVAGRQLAQAQAEEAEARTSAELAARRADRARADLAAAEAEVEANLDDLAAFARQTYKHGASSASPALLAMRSLSSGQGGADLADSLQATRLGLRAQRRIVEEAGVLRVRTETLAAAAEAEEATEQRFLEEALAASDRAAEAHAHVTQLMADASAAEARRADRLAELEEARQGIGQRISALETQVAQERAEREAQQRAREEAAREQAAREQAARAQAERERRAQERQSSPRRSGGGSSGSGSSGGGSTPVSAGPASGLVTVGGITVAAELGPPLKALLDAARADGVVLGGSGYRSPESQAALRRANGCPDVYSSPASSCRVPTAIPGNSEHEKGLAVDFTYGGRTICFPNPGSRCSGNRGFDWLKANAGRYGLKNLPSEAWHWSTTGR